MVTLALSLLCSAAAHALQAANAAPDLDAIVQRVIAREHVVGASVLVARGDRVLLHKGYGFADLGLEVPTKDETVYHVVGPMLPYVMIGVSLATLGISEKAPFAALCRFAYCSLNRYFRDRCHRP
jgi:hypothetical protein